VIGGDKPQVPEAVAVATATAYCESMKPFDDTALSFRELGFTNRISTTELEFVNPRNKYLTIKVKDRRFRDPDDAILAYVIEFKMTPPTSPRPTGETGQRLFAGTVTIWVDALEGKVVGGDSPF
jgi:hypothetical protein